MLELILQKNLFFSMGSLLCIAGLSGINFFCDLLQNSHAN